jgi:hypothetical protein
MLLVHWWVRGREKANVAWVRLRYSLTTIGISLRLRAVHPCI